MMDETPTVKLGERVVVKPNARDAVSGTEGVVVGSRQEPPAGLIVALDGTGHVNAVVAPSDVEPAKK